MPGAPSKFGVAGRPDRVDALLQAIDLGCHSRILAFPAPWDRDPDGRKPLAGSGERRELEPGAAVAAGARQCAKILLRVRTILENKLSRLHGKTRGTGSMHHWILHQWCRRLRGRYHQR
jgi:hypothetical protein